MTMYREFPQFNARATGQRPNVCVVTSELVGPFKNGGIGTSMTGLVESLAAAKFPVTVLYTGAIWSTQSSMQEWRDRYKSIGVDLVWLTLDDMDRAAGPVKDYGFATPYLVYDYLRDRSFDVIHFNDCMGEGFYCLTMKRLGAAFEKTLLCVAFHGPSQWVFELNRFLPDSVLCAAFNQAERLSSRCADLVWSPSRYLLDWTRDKGFVHPPATFVQQYVIPSAALFSPAKDAAFPHAAAPVQVQPTEFVFFGRLEERKGMRLFCAALRRLDSFLAEKNISVTFLGKAGDVGKENVMEYLKRQACDWNFAWKTVTNLGQQEAVDYIRSRPAVAVMPSPADNSPCTVYEALTFGIPFIAARTGGIPELVADEDQASVLFDYSPDALAQKLRQIVLDGFRSASPAHPQPENRRRWIEMHEQWQAFLPQIEIEGAPIGRLCAVVDLAAGQSAEATLASLMNTAAIAKIIVVNRSGAVLGQMPSPVPVVEVTADDADALASELSDTGFGAVLFLRAGTALLEHGLPNLLRALRTPGVDGLAPAARIDAGAKQQIAPPLGECPAFGFFQGVALTGGLIVKTDKLQHAIAGRLRIIEAEFFGLVDLAATGGLQIWPYAEPVLAHPHGYTPPCTAPATPEKIAAYARVSLDERFYITAVQTASARPTPSIGDRRQIGLRLSALGLGWAVRLGKRYIPPRVTNAVLARLHRPLQRLVRAPATASTNKA
jgi:glycosyltransferase involved in cell wall biosynthesis